ncbi:MAG: FtsX-like permease family protein, partial [Hungatella sp.]
GTENAVGKTFRTTLYGSTEDYTVVGVYRKEINALQTMMMGGASTNGSAFIPYTLLTRPNDSFYQLRIYAKKEINLSEFFDQFKGYVAKQINRGPEDMYFYTAMEEMTSVDKMMGGLSAAVGGIAAISLLVGGIGIMNIMLVSVTERTREIGIRKALGARTKDVLIQFLTESAILSACGGIIGVTMGVGLVSLGGAALGIAVVVKPSVIVIAVSFSAIVGIFFGLYPASKAAKADPIDALRYE